MSSYQLRSARNSKNPPEVKWVKIPTNKEQTSQIETLDTSRREQARREGDKYKGQSIDHSSLQDNEGIKQKLFELSYNIQKPRGGREDKYPANFR